MHYFLALAVTFLYACQPASQSEVKQTSDDSNGQNAEARDSDEDVMEIDEVLTLLNESAPEKRSLIAKGLTSIYDATVVKGTLEVRKPLMKTNKPKVQVITLAAKEGAETLPHTIHLAYRDLIAIKISDKARIKAANEKHLGNLQEFQQGDRLTFTAQLTFAEVSGEQLDQYYLWLEVLSYESKSESQAANYSKE